MTCDHWAGEVFWEGRCHLIQDIAGLRGCPRNALKTSGYPGAGEGQGRVGNAVTDVLMPAYRRLTLWADRPRTEHPGARPGA